MKMLEKYKQMPLPVKAGFWFTVSNFILKGISFITVPLFTRILSAEEYGIVTTFNSWQQIMSVIVTLSLSNAYIRGILKYKEDVDNFTSSIVMLSMLSTVFFFVISIPFSSQIAQTLQLPYSVFVIAIACYVVQPAYDFWTIRKRYSYEYIPMVCCTIGFTILMTGFSLWSVLSYKADAATKIESQLLVEIICYASFFIAYIIRFSRKNIGKYWKFALSFSLPLIPHTLSLLVLNQADRIMIKTYDGNTAAAVYGVAYSLASVLVLVQNSINLAFSPTRYQLLDAGEYKKISKISMILTIYIAIALIVFICMAPEVCRLLFPEEYYEARWIIPSVTMSILFMHVYAMFSCVEFHYQKTKYIMAASIIVAVFNIILNRIGIMFWGYLACGYTTLICYILLCVLHYIFMKKILREENINTPLYDMRQLILLLAMFVCFGIFITAVYDKIIVRYTIIVILGIVTCWKFKTIIQFFKSLKI